jgi:hypothetical protein
MLDRLERSLSERSFLLGAQVTERIGGCSRRYSGSTPSTTVTSNATAIAWWISLSYGTIRARLTKYQAWPRPYFRSYQDTLLWRPPNHQSDPRRRGRPSCRYARRLGSLFQSSMSDPNDSAQPRGKAGAASYARRARRFADPYDGFG